MLTRVKIPSRPYGLIPAIITPMNKRAQVDYEQLSRYIRWLNSFDIGGIAVNADTGEGPQLYEEERFQVVKIASDVTGARVPIIAGLNARNTDEAVRLAKQAKKAGADALLVFPHQAFAGERATNAIIAYHRAVIEGGGLPVVIFNLQQALGGVEYTLETLGELVRMRNVVAIKEASFSVRKFSEVVRVVRETSRRITILTGNDGQIYENLVLGAQGGLLGFGTIAVKEQIRMFDLYAKGQHREARVLWEKRLLPLERVIFARPVRDYRARLKEALRILGVIQTSYVRPPLARVEPQESVRIRAALRESGVV